MKKNLEDFPDLDKWFDNLSHTNGHHFVNTDSVVKKVTELAMEIERERSKVSELLFFIPSETRLHFINKWSEENKTN
jgi:hypothetical protein